MLTKTLRCALEMCRKWWFYRILQVCGVWFFSLLLRSYASKIDSCSGCDYWKNKIYRLLLLFNSCVTIYVDCK